MGTYQGVSRLSRWEAADIERDVEAVESDSGETVDPIEASLGPMPTVWEAMLAGMPRGGRKRERKMESHA